MGKTVFIRFIAINSLLLASGPAFSQPRGVEPVKEIELDKYLGKWYEIARLDFFFERGLINTTAEYSRKKNGMIKVVNRGYKAQREKWKEARGKARFRSDETNGALEVSFFGPFYAEYNIISIDDDYKYALVLGDTPEYMWILSREKTIPAAIKDKYLRIAGEAGVKIDELIWVEQNSSGK